jgi:hypothetical protein
MVKRRPHVGKIVYNAAGTYDANQKFINGALQEVNFACRFTASAGKFIQLTDGRKLAISGKVYADYFPEVIPDLSKLYFNGKEYVILRVHKYQTYVVIWV